MRVELASTETLYWIADLLLDDIPRLGDMIDFNGLFLVDRVVRHITKNEATVYISPAKMDMPVRKDEWRTDIEEAMDGKTKLLTVLHNGVRVVSTGGWDPLFKTWVYFHHSILTGTEPLAWMPVPAAMEA